MSFPFIVSRVLKNFREKFCLNIDHELHKINHSEYQLPLEYLPRMLGGGVDEAVRSLTTSCISPNVQTVDFSVP